MDFRIFNSTSNSSVLQSTRFPVINNGVNIYSPAVFKAGNIMVNPYETDFLTHAARNINLSNSFGEHFQDLPGHSDWAWYHPGNTPFYSDIEVLTAYSQGGASYFEYRSASTKNISPPNWINTFWNGYEIDRDSSVTGTNGNFGGFFWNMANFSAYTTNYEKLILSVAAIVSVKHDIFLPQPSSNSLIWGGQGLGDTHPYTAYFNKQEHITSLYVQGLAQPFKNFHFNVCYKGGDFTYNNTATNERMVYLGTYGRTLDNRTFKNTCSASNVQSLVTGNSNYAGMYYGDLNSQHTSYLTQQGGILRHFNYAPNGVSDGRDYFIFSCDVPLSSFTPSATSKSNMKAVTTPFFALTVGDVSATNFETSGLKWTNATAIANFLDGTQLTATGTFDLAPNGFVIEPELKVHDIKYGFSADI